MKLKTLLTPIVTFLSLEVTALESLVQHNQYDNPIVLQRADPFIHKHPDTGCYTFIGTSPKFDNIALRQACRLNDLKLAKEKVIWQKNGSGPLSLNIWAPELHQIDGDWYIYFAAGEKHRPFHIRMYVLKNSNKNPMDGDWQNLGKINTPWDSFALDATTFSHKGQRYLIWAQQDKAASYNSALWMAKMTSPTSIDYNVIQLTKPEHDWEIQGYKVNEGAAVLKRNGKIIVTYSASATDDRYAMGVLWANEDDNLMNPKSWQKNPAPIFSTNPEIDLYGPGHNSFVVAEDGKTDLMIYHARDYRQLQGNPLTDPNRHARVRQVNWNEAGLPQFDNQIKD